MKTYIIQSTIRGVKYFLKLDDKAWKGHTHEGLKDNATKFHSHGAAKTEMEFLIGKQHRGVELNIIEA